ncbi:MAG: hypothetical protein WAN35_09295 [Terracidiphilus sp.]
MSGLAGGIGVAAIVPPESGLRKHLRYSEKLAIREHEVHSFPPITKNAMDEHPHL